MADCSWFGECAVDGVAGAIEGAKDLVEGAKDVAENVSDFATFWTDPFGNTFRALQGAAHSLASDVLPALTKATMPDLTQQWWLSAYAIAFALAVFVMVILLLPSVLAVARGRASGADLFQTFALYVPLFLGGAMFGPAAGIFLVKFFGALTDSLVSWGITSSVDQVTAQMTQMLADEDASGIAGGAVIGILLMLLMCIGLVLVVVMLVVQLVTLYFTGILFPLAWVWITSRNTRKFGYKIAFVWLGILASHPLLFLLLGVAYSMIAAQVGVFEGVPTLQRLVTLLVSVIALWVAGFAPMTLYKFAPVMPLGMPSGTDSRSTSRTFGDADLNNTRERHQREMVSDPSTPGASAPTVVPAGGSGSGGGAVAAPSSSLTTNAAGGAGSREATGPASTSEATGRASTTNAAGDGGSREATGPASTSEAASSGRHAAGTEAGAGARGAATAEGSSAAAGATTAAEAGGVAAVGATGIGAVAIAAALAAKGAHDKAQQAHEAVHGAVQNSAADVAAYDADGVIGEDR